MVKDYRLPVHVREDRFGGYTLTLPASSPLRGPAVKGSRYLNQGWDSSILESYLSRHQAYRLRQSGSSGIVLRLDDELVMSLFGIDY